MSLQRFRPRYALKGQGLEDLYDVVDADDGCIVSDKPAPWDEASADARTRNAFMDARKLEDAPINAWLPAIGFRPEHLFAPMLAEVIRHIHHGDETA